MEKLIKNKLEPLIVINLLEYIEKKITEDQLIKKKYQPLIRMLRTYKNLKDNTEIGVPNRMTNIIVWDYMCSNNNSIDYLSISDINSIILMASLYYEKNYSKRKMDELLFNSETKIQKLNI